MSWLCAMPCIPDVPACRQVLLADLACVPCVRIACALPMQEGHYGKQRMFASAGWGVFSAMVGWIVSRTNIYSAFIMYSSLTAFALLPACVLKFHLKNHRQHHTRVSSSIAAAP